MFILGKWSQFKCCESNILKINIQWRQKFSHTSQGLIKQACKLGMSRHSLNAAVHVLLSECKQ